MDRRVLAPLFLAGLVVACGSSLPSLPRTPTTGWTAYREDAARVTVRLPATWKFVDAAHLPTQADIDNRKAAGDVMGTYLETATNAVKSGIFVFEAFDPATVSADIPFANSAYLSYIPGYGIDKEPKTLLTENLAATKTRYKLPQDALALTVNPPTGFEYAWQIQYTWSVTNSEKNITEQLGGVHYLLLRDEDAWILGFSTMLAGGQAALPTWRQIGGGISAPPLPLVIPQPLIIAGLIAGVALVLLAIFAVVIFVTRRRRRARFLAEVETARHKRGHHR